MYTLGIDPGLNGALAFVRHDDLIVYDMPTLEYNVAGKKKRREINMRMLDWMIKKHPTRHVIMEGLHGMPGMGGTQMFAMGQGYGMLKAALYFNAKPYDLVSPQKWKKYYGLSKDKDASLKTASELFPTFANLWARKKDDGRAEAALIANYRIQNPDIFNQNEGTLL